MKPTLGILGSSHRPSDANDGTRSGGPSHQIHFLCVKQHCVAARLYENKEVPGFDQSRDHGVLQG